MEIVCDYHFILKLNCNTFYAKLVRKEKNMIESKGWNWEIVKEDKIEISKNPSIESYYLLNRWKSQKRKILKLLRYIR